MATNEGGDAARRFIVPGSTIRQPNVTCITNGGVEFSDSHQSFIRCGSQRRETDDTGLPLFVPRANKQWCPNVLSLDFDVARE